MAYVDGTLITPSMVGLVESISEEVATHMPMETPVLDLIGIDGKGMASQVVNVQHYWEEETYQPNRTQLNGALTSTGTAITVDDAVLRVGQVLQIDRELIYVSGVGADFTTGTITRGYLSTTGAAHSDNDKVLIVAQPRVQGAALGQAQSSEPSQVFNYTQILERALSLSGTAQAVSQHGGGNSYAAKRAREEKALLQQLEYSLLYGKRQAPASGTAGMMGGVQQYVTTNLYSLSSKDLQPSNLDTAIKDMIDAGVPVNAMEYLLLVPSRQKQIINTWGNQYLQTVRNEQVYGGAIEYIETVAGQVRVMHHPRIFPSHAFLLNLSNIGVGPLNGAASRAFFHQFTAINGDRVEGEIIGEYTCEIRHEKSHAWFHTIKTS